jgi:hypothetical protein
MRSQGSAAWSPRPASTPPGMRLAAQRIVVGMPDSDPRFRMLLHLSRFRGRCSAAAASVVVLALSLAACGGGSTRVATRAQGPTPTSTATTTTAPPSKAPATRTHGHSRTTSAKGTAASHTTSTISTPSTASNTHITTSSRTTPTPSSPGLHGTTLVYTPPIHATFAGENHAPKVNQAWSYLITVTDAKGHAMSGTVDTEFALGGQVVGHETPPTHPIRNGRLHDTLQFPADSVGVPLDVQAVVHTSLGSSTLDWAVKVQH